MDERLHVMHIFPELSLGGAEIVMLNLIRGTSELLIHHVIASDVSEPSFLAEVRAAGAVLTILPSFRRHPLKFMIGIRSIVGEKKPAVVHSWMYLANIASLAVPSSTPVVWSFHGERLSQKLLPLMAELALVPLSYFSPSAIVFPSKATWRNYMRAGFKSCISSYIHNPVDTSLFFPDAEGGVNYRRGRAYPRGIIIGCAARWHPEKGHLHLFDAIRNALDKGANITLACVGRHMDDRSAEVKEAVRTRGLEERVLLLGQENDMRGFYNSLDLLVVPSKTEAFGNVIIEAYACGVPVLSTNCGGPLEIIVNPEHIVPIGDVQAMSSVLHQFAENLWRPSSEKLVEYAQRYSLGVVGKQYASLYQRHL
jgi:glycosyltransferase involved in cell wall biosynthesis